MTDQQSIRVLLIEDNPGDARLVRELLTEEGDRFGIILAGSLREARDRLAAEGRTVFVSSHLMGEMALTADHLVIIGRGRPPARTMISAASSSIEVGSPSTITRS